MHTATLHLRNTRTGADYTSTVQHDDLDMFYAMFAGAVQGALGFDVVLVSVDREVWA